MIEVTNFYLVFCYGSFLFAVDDFNNCPPCPNETAGGTISSLGYPNDYSTKGSFLCNYHLLATGHSVKMTLAKGANIPNIDSFQV